MQGSTIQLDIREFLCTGALGPIAVGMSRDKVFESLGMPERWGIQNHHQAASIWLYGDIELHFGIFRTNDTDTLEMIFSDHLDWSRTSSRIRILPWILREGLTLANAYDSLLAAGFEPKEAAVQGLPGTHDLVFPSGVSLRFSTENNPLCPVLSGIWQTQPA